MTKPKRTKPQPRKAPRPPSRVERTSELLVEIGTEELPAAYLEPLLADLQRDAQKLFEASHIKATDIVTYGTPRRLILHVGRCAKVQQQPPEEIRGPSRHAAFDAEGRPTKALEGFLRARGGTRAQTKLVATQKGDYVYLVKPRQTHPVERVLPELLAGLIRGLHTPKSMRWDTSGARFARPIRWLLVLLGARPVRLTFGSLRSGTSTIVGGPLRPRTVRVKHATQYFKILQRAGILWNPATRREWITGQLTTLSKAHGAKPVPELVTHGLLDEVAALLECPTAVVGRFEKKYVVLPREVLLASMAKYQRVFAMQDHQRYVVPRFIAILEGRPRKRERVRQVYEHILNARLADSLLFWKQDHRELPLERLAQRLEGVAFHKQLGSMAEKGTRLQRLSETLGQSWNLAAEDMDRLRRACGLAKADLVSTMVREFPTLQGVMGKYYAQASNQPEAIGVAIEEHYLPAGGRLPRTLLGSALAILDKYDTLSSYFSLGIVPTGDQDPFGLRRAAQGIVEIAWHTHRSLPLDQLLRDRASLKPFGPTGATDTTALTNEVGQKLQQYLLERLYTFHWPRPAPARDLIDAVLGSPSRGDLVDVMDRIVSLQRLNGSQTVLKAAKVVERTHNILKGVTVRTPAVDASQLREPPEQHLWSVYQTHQERLMALIERKAYAEATTLYGEVFFDPLHTFFERVLVNVNEEATQQNRLALLQAINTLYTARVADLSKLTILQQANSEVSRA